MRRILVPLDGTPEAESALPLARLLARRAGAELVLAHVVEPLAPAEGLSAGSIAGAVPLTSPDPRVARELRRARQDYLDDVLARTQATLRPAAPDRRAPEARPPAGGTDGPAARGVLLDGDPSTALHRSAVDIAADLVVMASHGRRGLARLVLGSITEDVVRAGGVPVLVVPRADVQEEEGRGGPTPEALEAPLPRHLLVALDGSREAEAILEPAVGLARMLGSLVTVATVRDDERSPRATLLPTSILDTESSGERAGAPVPAEPAGEESPDPVPGSAAGDSEYLDGIARRLAGEGCSAVPRVLAGPQVVDRLLACPDELGVDWFALTSHGHGLWKRWIEGSVAEALLQRATVPVLLLHPHPTR